MRKLVAILMLAVFGLPLASPAFALGRSAGDGVRACCRRGGAHHCMEMMAEAAKGDTGAPRWSAPPQCCPFAPTATAPLHQEIAAPPAAAAIFAALVSHPAVHAQTQSMWRIARDRSRSKRGPPAVSLL